MSVASLKAIEDAIDAHFRDTSDPDNLDRQGAVVVDWVVGYTISGIVGDVVGYSNDYCSSDSNPNSQVTLAAWVSENIMDGLRNGFDEEDD